jgi:hypothetical protein
MAQLSFVDAGLMDVKKLTIKENKAYWEQQGKAIAEELRKESAVSDKNEGKALWQIGDWLLRGEIELKYGDRKLRNEACYITGRAWGTLKNYKSMAKLFTEDRRRPNVSWTIHKELLTIKDLEEQEKWLDAAEKWNLKGSKHMSVEDLRKMIGRNVPSHKRRQPKDDRKNITLPLGDANREIFLELAAMYEPTGVLRTKNNAEALLYDIVYSYLFRNQDAIKPMRDAYRAGAYHVDHKAGPFRAGYSKPQRLPELLYDWKEKTEPAKPQKAAEPAKPEVPETVEAK